MMRLRPFTSPSPHATGLSSNYASDHIRRAPSIVDDEAILLAGSDPETTRLLPCRQRRHRVRIQGRLAIVRIASVANLRQAKNGGPAALMDINCEDMRGPLPRRQDSYDCSEAEDDNDEEDDVTERDAQLRGYGIGGAGNIRR
ncbi:hypothetical protein F4803DRAFT_521950 [Xylaria telfairii]|nr:hypothetical protein F4803DRAFT_521950 [Xylaria telfairii]